MAIPSHPAALRCLPHASLQVRAGSGGVESAAFRGENIMMISQGGDTRWAYKVFVANLAWGVTSRMLFDAIEVCMHTYTRNIYISNVQARHAVALCM